MKLRRLLSLAWRESRFARRRLFLFLSAISLGVAALVAVQGFAANLQGEVERQARAILGADASLSSRQPFGDGTEAVLDSLASAGVEVARVTSFASMALHPESGATRLVQLRAAEPGYPLYGEIRTRPAGVWRSLHEGRDVVVDPGLLVALDAAVGDSIAIGATRFRISGALERLPGDIEAASAFAPRAFIAAAYLAETELLGHGARVDYDAYLRLPAPGAAESIVEGYRPLWRAERVRARTLEDQQERMGEALGSLASFLGLVGVFALLLGGIGVASAMSAYMARKAETVAILRCLGASAGQVLTIYLVQAAVMGLAGAALGVALGGGVQWLLPRLLAGLLPVDVPIRLDGRVITTGLAVGLWAAVVFALLPLLRVRRISPLGALRRGVEPVVIRGFDLPRYLAWGLLVLSVLLLVVLQTGRPLLGVYLTVGVAATLLLLWLAARAATLLVRRPPRGLAYTLRQGIANLHRPSNQTTTVVLALGFGVSLIGTLLLIQSSILAPLGVDAEGRGNLLLFDIQSEQLADVEEVLGDAGVNITSQAPLVPMRIAAVDGVAAQGAGRDAAGGAGADPVDDDVMDDDADGGREGWAVRREYRSTYRDTLTSSETLVAGRWFGAGGGAGGEAFEVSLDEDVAGELGVEVGGRIDWDVQGVRVPTVVTSLRSIDWARFEPNFYAVFEPRALQGAPQMWVVLARAAGERERAAVQRDIIARHPNIAAVDLTLVQRALDDVVGRVALVVRFLAGFSVATGFVVLLGAAAAGRLQRIRESVLLKTLGATRRQVALILLTEYALLGLLAVIVGLGLALAAGWGLAHFLFDVALVLEPTPLMILGFGVVALSAAIGLFASREVYRATPMEAIREG